MTTELTIAIVISIIGSIIGVVSFFRNDKNNSIADSRVNAAELASLKEQVKMLQQMVNAENIGETKAIQQSLRNLVQRVDKLDIDVDKKIDQINDKVDKLMLKLNEILLEIAQNRK